MLCLKINIPLCCWRCGSWVKNNDSLGWHFSGFLEFEDKSWQLISNKLNLSDLLSPVWTFQKEPSPGTASSTAAWMNLAAGAQQERGQSPSLIFPINPLILHYGAAARVVYLFMVLLAKQGKACAEKPQSSLLTELWAVCHRQRATESSSSQDDTSRRGFDVLHQNPPTILCPSQWGRGWEIHGNAWALWNTPSLVMQQPPRMDQELHPILQASGMV